MSDRDALVAAPDPLPWPVTDNHCHLDIARGDFSTGRDDVALGVADAIERAASVGVSRIVQIGCDLPGARWAVEAAREHPALVAGVAIHPNEAPVLAERGELDDALAEIAELATDPVVRVVGETGLDYFRTGEAGRAAQHESFRRHVEIAHETGRALQIHDRDAHEDVLRVLDEVGAPPRWVMHCFSGDAAFAHECLERGAHLSFSGTVTFKNAEPLREALRVTPLDRVLVETDAPFLTPAPHRGRPNASYLVPLTVRSMAATLEMDVEPLCEAIAATTEACYGRW